MMRANWSVLQLLVFLALVACNSRDAALSAPRPPAVAYVDDAPITLERARHAFCLQRLLADGAGAPGPEADRVLAQSVVDDLIERHLLVRAAEGAHVTVVQSDVDAAYAQLAQGYGSEQFANVLAEHALTPIELKAAVRERLLAARYLRTQLLDRLAILDSDIDAHVLAHPEVLAAPRQLRAAHIVLEDEPRAAEVVREVRRGLSFAAAAARFSLAADGAQGGELGLLTEEAVPHEVWAALDKLPLRQLSKPVAQADGLHLFYVSERLGARQLRLADVRLQIEARLRHKAEAEAAVAHVRKLKESSHVVVDDARVAQIPTL